MKGAGLLAYTTLFRSIGGEVHWVGPPPLVGSLGCLDARELRRSSGRIGGGAPQFARIDRKSTRLNSSHGSTSYAVFCLKKKKKRVSYNEHDINEDSWP